MARRAGGICRPQHSESGVVGRACGKSLSPTLDMYTMTSSLPTSCGSEEDPAAPTRSTVSCSDPPLAQTNLKSTSWAPRVVPATEDTLIAISAAHPLPAQSQVLPVGASTVESLKLSWVAAWERSHRQHPGTDG